MQGGWIVAKSGSWPCRQVPTLAVCLDFHGVVALTLDCRRVAVDVPVGIPSGKAVRSCDGNLVLIRRSVYFNKYSFQNSMEARNW